MDLSEYKFDEEMSLCIEEGGDDFDSLFKQGMLRALTGRTVGKDTAFKVSCDAIGEGTTQVFKKRLILGEVSVQALLDGGRNRGE